MSMNNASSETPLVERVNEAIRENPLAAGLIGAGLAWMILRTKGFSALGGLAASAGDKVVTATNRAGSAAVGAGEIAVSAGAKVSAAVREASDGVVGGLSALVPDVSIEDSGEQVAKVLSSKGSEYSSAIKSRLSESLEQQPLLIGVIGLAVGAGIASTFASTSIESEWLGAQGAAVRGKIDEVVDEAKLQGSALISDIKDEATRQGLTKKGAGNLIGKAGNVANAAKGAIGFGNS